MEISKAEMANAANAAAAATQSPIELRGGEILVKALQAENVKYIWGYPGGAVLHIYDAFFKQDTIQHVLVRHEQAAVHAADGYARATGDVGVALVTSGPGLTNAVTGIATAYMDSIPMVIISGQVPTAAIGLDAFQECDTVGITRPIVKHNFLVKDAKDMAEVMKKAFHIARTGRPGPVVVDIPKDVSFKKALYSGYPEDVTMRSYNPVRKGHSGQIRKALGLLMGAKRPYIYTGGGVLLSNASDEVRALVNMIGAPCTSTLMGLGAIPASDPKFLGMLGMHGTIEANNAMQHCDVLIAIGARFDDRVIGNPKHFAQNERKIVHIDIDPSSISKRVKVDVPIVGDVKDVLTELMNLITESKAKMDAKALADWNGLGPDLMVREGQFLIIPTPADISRLPADAQVADATAPGEGTPTPTPPSSKEPLPDEETVTVAEAAQEPTPAPDLSSERTAASATAMGMPVDGKILRAWDGKTSQGIDIAAAAGTAVHAAAEGTVAVITHDAKTGALIVILRHADGLLTVYAGLDSATVEKGAAVKRGQTIGTVKDGSPAQLHFEVRQMGKPVDPVGMLPGR